VGNPPNRRRWVKAARYAAYCAAALVTLVIVAAFILPELLDSPAVRAEIQRKLAAAVRGDVTWEDLSVRILPAPHGALRKVRVEIPELATVSAEQVDAHLRLWPLLRGRAEIASVTLVNPDIQVSLKPAPAEEKSQQKASADFLELYRSVVGAIVQGVREFAPDTVIGIENAGVDVRVPGMPPVQLSRLTLRARSGMQGLDLDATAASPYWDRLKLSARIAFADLSAKASLDATDLKPQAWLDRFLAKSPVEVAVPRAGLRVQAHTDGKKSLECQFAVDAGRVEIARAGERVRVQDVAMKGKVVAGSSEIAIHVSDTRLGPSRLTGGVLRYSPKDGSLAGDIGYDLDLAQGMDITRRLVPAASAALSWFNPVTGRAQGRVNLALGRPDWSVGVDIAKSDASVQVRDLPGPVRLAHAIVEIDRHGVKVNRATASMPAGQVRLWTLHHSYRNQATVASAEFDIDLAQGLDLARRALPEGNRDALAAIQSASGRARGTTKLAFGRKDWSVGVEIQKADAQVQMRGLPAPAGLTRGSVHATAGSVKVDRAALSLLDAMATASATISGFGDGLRVQGSISEGTVGGKFLEWVWKTVDAPPHLALKTPIGITAPRFVWGSKGALDVNATARFATDLSVGVDLGWASGGLHVRRVTVKDQRSNAAIGARIAGSRVEGQFSGSLHGSSIASMLRSVLPQEGGVSGKLRFAFDRERPRDASAEGNLKGESLDISWLTGHPVKIERIDLAADGTSLQIREATVNWAGQRATIRGDVKQGAGGPVIDARLDSAGIDVDALLEAKGPEKKPPAGSRERSGLWPLPITGQFVLRSNFVQRGRYRVAPIAATLALQEQRAHLDLQQAQLCGISLPLAIEATPAGFVASAKITARKQPLQQAVHCLTDHHVSLTGEFDLSADISSQGKAGELARNLKGSVSGDLRDGSIMKFALLGNILSMQNVTRLFKQGGPRLDESGFPYRAITIRGRFENGRFNVDEGAFHSDAVGLAAHGWISLSEPQSRLTVLVAPFSRVDELVRSVPLFGYIIGGAFTSVPVGVSGDIRDPTVIPLGPGAVTSELTGIFERTLKLPVKLVTPADKNP
jgi:AsmA-like protein